MPLLYKKFKFSCFMREKEGGIDRFFITKKATTPRCYDFLLFNQRRQRFLPRR
jgi:hypothetical protein